MWGEVFWWVGTLGSVGTVGTVGSPPGRCAIVRADGRGGNTEAVEADQPFTG